MGERLRAPACPFLPREWRISPCGCSLPALGARQLGCLPLQGQVEGVGTGSGRGSRSPLCQASPTGWARGWAGSAETARRGRAEHSDLAAGRGRVMATPRPGCQLSQNQHSSDRGGTSKSQQSGHGANSGSYQFCAPTPSLPQSPMPTHAWQRQQGCPSCTTQHIMPHPDLAFPKPLCPVTHKPPLYLLCTRPMRSAPLAI